MQDCLRFAECPLADSRNIHLTWGIRTADATWALLAEGATWEIWKMLRVLCRKHAFARVKAKTPSPQTQDWLTA